MYNYKIYILWIKLGHNTWDAAANSIKPDCLASDVIYFPDGREPNQMHVSLVAKWAKIKLENNSLS